MTEEQDGTGPLAGVTMTVVVAGPFLSRDEALIAKERERLARLCEQRAARLDRYAESYNDEEALTAMTLAHGYRGAAEIVRFGDCPHCAGSAAELGGRRKGSSLICRVCGVDRTDYSRASRASKPVSNSTAKR